MKRLFNTIVILVLMLLVSGATVQTICYEQEYVTLYSLDGREETVKIEDVDAQLTVGWYLEPVVQLYALDGRVEIVPISKKNEQLTVGWYEEPMVELYALDGRTEIIPLKDKAEQLSVGWYEYPININYSAFEKTNIPASLLEKMLKGSCLEGCGQYFYNMEQQYNVNSIFAIAVTQVESSMGKHNANKNNF